MARGGKKEVSAAADPEAEERVRLKKLAFAGNILSQSLSKVGRHSAALAPSKTVIKHHGKDIIRKSQRKNKYLFSFPGLLGPISGGKIGDLKDLGTKNPILYLDFPQGQMKLFGTIVYPKNRYLTLQFSKGGKNVTCDDYFDNVIVFSDAWWIGTKEENPNESRLQFPKNLDVEKRVEYDFKGGIGSTCDGKQGSGKSTVKCVGQDSPEVNLDDDLADSPSDYKELAAVTPARQSARTAGKTFNFAEASSGDDFIGNGDETPGEEDEKIDAITGRNFTSIETENSSPLVFEIDNDAMQDPASEPYKQTGKAMDLSDTDQRSLVQTTLSSLFKRVEEKKTKKDVTQINTSKASKLTKGRKKVEEREPGTVSKEQKKQHKKIELVDPVSVHQRKSKAKASGASSSKRRRADVVSTSQSSDPNDSTQVEDDDIEEFSSTSQDMSASDEDWTA